MANLNEILQIENNRETDASWRVIHLHKDGKFYRAYQFSDWLYSCAINQYKVTNHRFKSVGINVLFVGFPEESLLKWISSNMGVTQVDDNQLQIELPDAVGIPEEQLRKASESAVCKINIDSDSRLAMTAAIRKHFAENPGHFDPRQYLKPARENMKKMYVHKIMNVLGSNDKL